MYYLEARADERVTRIPIAEGQALLGRAAECDLTIDHASVSRRHATIDVRDGVVRVEDCGSRNGVTLGGERVTKGEIALGRWFLVGSVLVSVRRGVTLSSRPVSPKAVANAGRTAVTLGPEGGASAPQDLLTLDLLAGDASDPQARLDALLERVGMSLGARACCLVETRRGQAVLCASWGDPDAHDAPHADEGWRSWTARVARPGDELALRVLEPAVQTAPHDAALSALADVAAGWLALGNAPYATRGIADEKSLATRPLRPERSSLAESSPHLRALLEECEHLAPVRLSILIQGETGSGKERVARHIHEASARTGPFLALNCAALPRELLEAELFGIARGVATGVEPRAGLLVSASGGTLLLDEIGDLPGDLQPKLLRALESGEVLPVGARVPERVDVRVIAATHRDLDACVAKGDFRADLFHRLAGAIVHVPPLRERPADILPIARQLLREAAEQSGVAPVALDYDAARRLVGHDWPGNVRELRNVLERALALSRSGVIDTSHLPPALSKGTDEPRADFALTLSEGFREARRAFERLYFARLLEEVDGNLSRASERAGLARGSLYRKLDELGLRDAASRDSGES